MKSFIANPTNYFDHCFEILEFYQVLYRMAKALYNFNLTTTSTEFKYS